jgi:hypothetical protein
MRGGKEWGDKAPPVGMGQIAMQKQQAGFALSPQVSSSMSAPSTGMKERSGSWPSTA